MLGFRNVAVGRINEMAPLTSFSYKTMYEHFAGTKKSGRNNEVAVWWGSTVLLYVVFIFSLIKYPEKVITYAKYKYPLWAEVLGYFMAGLQIIYIPGYVVFRISKETGSLKEVKPREIVLESICGSKLN